MNEENPTTAITPFEPIRRTNPTGSEFCSSRDFAQVLGYTDYRNFEAAIEKARTACFNSGQRVEDHFVEITEMVEIGSGAQRPIRTVMMSRYACYLVIQNADPAKEIVAVGQTYFAVQTRRHDGILAPNSRIATILRSKSNYRPRVAITPCNTSACECNYIATKQLFIIGNEAECSDHRKQKI